MCELSYLKGLSFKADFSLHLCFMEREHKLMTMVDFHLFVYISQEKGKLYWLCVYELHYHEMWTIADWNKNKIWVNKIFAKQRSQDSLVQSSGNPTPISTIKAGRASFPSTAPHASLGDVCKFPSSTHQAGKLSSFLWGNNILLMSG